MSGATDVKRILIPSRIYRGGKVRKRRKAAEPKAGLKAGPKGAEPEVLDTPEKIAKEIGTDAPVDVDLMKLKTIKVEIREPVPLYEQLEKDDTIFRIELENELLSELPLSQQSSEVYQERIAREVEAILELKNQGLRLVDRGPNAILNDYQDGHFNQTWLIPVVLDKKTIYVSNDEVNVRQGAAPAPPEPNSGSATTTLGLQLDRLHKLDSQFGKGEIDPFTYYRAVNELVAPYHSVFDMGGYKQTVLENLTALRREGIETPDFQSNFWFSAMDRIFDVYDDNKIVDRRVKTIIPADVVNVVGFMIISPRDRRLFGYLERTNYMIHLTEAAEIGAIRIGQQTEIEYKQVPGVPPLVAGQTVHIVGSDSMPRVDGEHVVAAVEKKGGKDILLLDINTEGGQGGESGRIYTRAPIAANVYRIDDKNKVRDVAKTEHEHAVDLYLFDQVKISTYDDFRKVLELIIPSIDAVLAKMVSEGDRPHTLGQLDTALTKRGLTRQSLNKEQMAPIRAQLEQAIRKSAPKDIEIPRPPPAKPVESIIYDLKYIQDPAIAEYYGEYPRTAYDSEETRQNWIENKPDSGAYYYYFVVSQLDLKQELMDPAEIAAELSRVKKAFAKEKKMASAFDENCASLVRRVYESGDELRRDMIKDYKTDDYAYTLKEGDVYQWEAKGWKLRPEMTLEDLREYCELGGKDLTKVSVKDLECIFNSRSGCRSRRVMRYETRVQNLEGALADAESRKDFKDGKQELATELDRARADLYRFRAAARDDVESARNISFNDVLEIPGIELMSKIDNVADPQVRQYLLWKLITIDGITINGFVYSKRHKVPMMCSHWLYIWRIQSAENYSRPQVVQEMVMRYGRTANGYYRCRVCGEVLEEVEKDNVASIDADGHLVRTADTAVEKIDITEQFDERILGEDLSCDNVALYQYLTEDRGMRVEYDSLRSYCKYMEAMLNQMGVSLRPDDYLWAMESVYRSVESRASLKVYKEQVIARMRKQGKSQKEILKIPEEKFRSMYEQYYFTRIFTAVSSRLLTVFQTATPSYQVKKRRGKCAFEGFEGAEGVRYMTCLVGGLEEGRRVRGLEEKIERDLEYLRRRPEIRQKYDVVLARREAERAPVDARLATLLMGEAEEPKKLAPNPVKETLAHVDARAAYVGRQIKNGIVEFMETERKAEKQTGTPMERLGCCPYPAETGFFDAIPQVAKWIKDSAEFAEYYRRFVETGSVSILQMPRAIPIATANAAIRIRSPPSPAIVKLKFEYFCRIGPTRGEMHYFIGSGKQRRCAKCGEFLADIVKNDYTANEFAELLKTIRDKTSAPYHPPVEYDQVLSTEDLTKLVETAEQNIKAETAALLDRIAKLLGKDREVMKGYEEFLESMGNYAPPVATTVWEQFGIDSGAGANGTRKRDILQEDVRRQVYRVEFLKTAINMYFRRYISQLAHRKFELTPRFTRIDEVDKSTATALQKDLYDKHNRLGEFFVDNYSLIFRTLQFSLSFTEVADIDPATDIYDREWERILEASEFNYEHAATALRYVLIRDLNQFILYNSAKMKKKFPDQELYPDPDTEVARIVAKFVLTVFDILREKEAAENVPRADYMRFVETMEFNQATENGQKHMKISDIGKVLMYGKFGTDLNKIGEDEWIEEEAVDLAQASYKEAVRTKVETDLRTKGEQITEDVVEEIASEVMGFEAAESEIRDELYSVDEMTRMGDETGEGELEDEDVL